ncbi:hypothetical protein [Paenibacillus sp. MMS20-IR301]|uniref:hypothetical protein n=1 Tax=Paenibacillus sp. MMS20-IR301 TaxID=2895946 RepID=UPI0028E8F69F|nr:hypothetical protein [Paenibacillus sp. MMS20-IR301]WNS41174.1 hypothetical protein LOS79_19245 [Paenibacillus sp. MMS20-IR301]
MLGLLVSERERVWKRKRVLFLIIAYLCIVAIYAFRLIQKGEGVYDYGEGRAVLTNLNLSWFVLQDMSFIVQAIIVPIFAIGSLCDEITSGAYRFYMLRPFGRFQHLLVKLYAQLEVIFIFIAATYVLSTILAWVFLPHSSSAVLYHSTTQVSSIQANIYSFKLFGIHFLTCTLMLMMSSVICFFVPISVIAFILILFLPFVIYLMNSEFLILNNPFSVVLDVLSDTGHSVFWFYLGGSLLVFTLVSFVQWNRKSI